MLINCHNSHLLPAEPAFKIDFLEFVIIYWLNFYVAISVFPGITRRHFPEFKKDRRERIERYVVETNKILIRLEKVNVYQTCWICSFCGKIKCYFSILVSLHLWFSNWNKTLLDHIPSSEPQALMKSSTSQVCVIVPVENFWVPTIDFHSN